MFSTTPITRTNKFCYLTAHSVHCNTALNALSVGCNYQTTRDLCSYHFTQPTLFQHFQQMHIRDYIDTPILKPQTLDRRTQYITSHINTVIIPEEDGHPERKVRIIANSES
jgi:hypothetical protein